MASRSSQAPRLRAITTAGDPLLRLSDLQRLDQLSDGVLWVLRMWLAPTRRALRVQPTEALRAE
jgi:hypothetical protein